MTLADIFNSIIGLIFIVAILFAVYLFLHRLKTKRLLKNYDETKNISRRTPEGDSGNGTRDSGIQTTDRGIEETKPLDGGLDESTERELLPTAETSNDGKGSSGSGKDSRGIAKLRRRFKKR